VLRVSTCTGTTWSGTAGKASNTRLLALTERQTPTIAEQIHARRVALLRRGSTNIEEMSDWGRGRRRRPASTA
jgi:hypothetical protein